MAKKDKEAATDDPAKMSRRQQIVETYRMTKETDRGIGAGGCSARSWSAAAIGFGIFWLLPPAAAPSPWSSPIIGGAAARPARPR